MEREVEEQHDNEQVFITQNDTLDRIEEQEEIDEDDVAETFESVISTSASDNEKKKASTKVDSEQQTFGQILMYKVVYNELEHSVQKVAYPKVALYLHQGSQLEWMNQAEYDTMIQTI